MRRLSTQRPRFAPHRIAARYGFTLFEVLVALALSVILMTAVYSGLNLYWRFSTAGQVEAEQAQLARAIFRQIELDLRSVVYAAPSQNASGGGGSGASSGGSSSSSSSNSSSGSSGGTSSGSGSNSSSSSSPSSSSTTEETQTTAPADALTTTAIGLFGDPDTLMIHISKPSRMESYSPIGAGGGRTSDLLSVAYFLGGNSSPLAAFASSSGLARMAGDRLLMGMADQQGNQSLLASQTRILAPEVVGLQFGYFDGTYWQTSWDSTTAGGIPKAVEVVIEVATQQPGASESRARYQLIVALPGGKPMTAATSTSTTTGN